MFGSLPEPKFHFHFKRGISHMATQAAPDQRRGLALALLAATQFVLILDASIVNVALPSIGRDLAFAPQDLSWVANAYTLTFGGFLLLGGRIADLTGRRRVFMAGPPPLFLSSTRRAA